MDLNTEMKHQYSSIILLVIFNATDKVEGHALLEIFSSPVGAGAGSRVLVYFVSFCCYLESTPVTIGVPL